MEIMKNSGKNLANCCNLPILPKFFVTKVFLLYSISFIFSVLVNILMQTMILQFCVLCKNYFVYELWKCLFGSVKCPCK